MQLGMVGLGRMGRNMATRLTRKGHEVVAFDVSPKAVESARAEGLAGADSLEDLVAQLQPPRAVWVMVPAGDPTESTVQKLAGLVSSGDAIIDGGNSKYTDDLRRSAELKPKGIDYLDAGTSGGIWGLERGYCLMVGGPRPAFDRIEPIFRDLAPEGGYAYMGTAGSGHYVKMIHNGIEYAIMQAYAEGFELMSKAQFDGSGLDLAAVSEVWRHGSVIASWLLDLTADALRANPTLEGIAAYVEDSGEGRWTVEDGLNKSVPTPTIAASLYTRFRSRESEPYSERLLASMRHAFGGHAIKAKNPAPPKPGG